MTFTISIIGKPNVGKSTIFNKLCGKRLAITDDRPGVTRDAKIFPAKLSDLTFNLIDTAGIEKSVNVLTDKMLTHTLKSIENSNVVLFTVDARNGLNGTDLELAQKVRKYNKSIILIANKAEGKVKATEAELYKLGFGEPIFISAEHNLGFNELYIALNKAFKSLTKPEEALDNGLSNKNLKLAILGRPNVGKSTLFNAILGFERSIVSDISGTTRDSISHIIQYKEHSIELVDTAGMRRKTRIDDKIEELSVVESINTLRRAHVVALVIDATQPLENQDLSIANLAIQEGKAMLLVVNKCDLIEDRKKFLNELQYLAEKTMTDIKGIPIILISATENYNIQAIFREALRVEKSWMKEISTGVLNNWLARETERHIPPIASNGRRIRFKYIVQSATRPPTFTIFCNIPEKLPHSYTRYLDQSLRDNFGFFGVPIRIKYRKNANPYLKD